MVSIADEQDLAARLIQESLVPTRFTRALERRPAPEPIGLLEDAPSPIPVKRVATVALFSGPLLCLGRRNDNGKWTTPGGHFEDGEHPYVAAARETHEEAGIQLASGDLYALGHERITKPDGEELDIYCFRSEVVGRETDVTGDPDGEVSDWRWVDVSQGLPPAIANNLHVPIADNVLMRALGLGDIDDDLIAEEKLEKTKHGFKTADGRFELRSIKKPAPKPGSRYSPMSSHDWLLRDNSEGGKLYYGIPDLSTAKDRIKELRRSIRESRESRVKRKLARLGKQVDQVQREVENHPTLSVMAQALDDSLWDLRRAFEKEDARAKDLAREQAVAAKAAAAQDPTAELDAVDVVESMGYNDWMNVRGKADSSLVQAIVDSVERKWGKKVLTMSADEMSNVVHNWAMIHAGDDEKKKRGDKYLGLEDMPDIAASAQLALARLMAKRDA